MNKASLFLRHRKAFYLGFVEKNMKTTKSHIFVFNIACATIGTRVPIVAMVRPAATEVFCHNTTPVDEQASNRTHHIRTIL